MQPSGMYFARILFLPYLYLLFYMRIHYLLHEENMIRPLIAFLIFIFLPIGGFAATTGKIAGFVRDAATQDPLAGVNIYVVGTGLYAISGLNGGYFILNVPVGVYRVVARMIGYLPV